MTSTLEDSRTGRKMGPLAHDCMILRARLLSDFSFAPARLGQLAESLRASM